MRSNTFGVVVQQFLLWGNRAAVLILSLWLLSTLPAAAQGNWNQVYHEDQHPTKNINLEAVTYANGRFVTVGHANGKNNTGSRQVMIMTSSNGTDWSDVSPDLGLNGSYLFDIIDADGLFVAVGNDSTQATGYNEETLIVTSSDGINWQRILHNGLPLYNFWAYISYGDNGSGSGRYVLAADTTLYYSDDLLTWSEATEPTATDGVYWNDVTYGNGSFMAVGRSGGSYATYRLTSSDGVNWSIQADSDVGHNTVEFINNRFVNIGVSGGTHISSGTTTWEEVTPKSISSNTIYSVDYANDTYIFGGGAIGTGNSHGYIWVSDDLNNWWREKLNSEVEGGIRSLAHDAAGFVGIADNLGMIYYSAFSSASNAPQFTSARTITARVDEEMEYNVTVSGMPATDYYYGKYNLDPDSAFYQLPAGLFFNSTANSGTLSGTPSEEANIDLRFSLRPRTATAAGSREIEAAVNLVIGSAAPTVVCDSSHHDACTTISSCSSVSGYWNFDNCSSTPQSDSSHYETYCQQGYSSYCDNSAPTSGSCAEASLEYCTDTDSCSSAGGSWLNNSCSDSTDEPSDKTPSGESILFREDFESYTATELVTNKNGWEGDAAYVNRGTYLASNVLDGRFDIGQDIFSIIYNNLSRSLSSSQVTTFSFDAYATTTAPISHNAVIGFGIGGDGAKLFWNPAENGRNSGMWSFDARGVTGNPTDYQRISGGFDQAVSLKIVIDGPAGELYGLYDIGSGEQKTVVYSVSSESIERLNAVYLNPDFRSPTAASTSLGSRYSGIEVDNIEVSISDDGANSNGNASSGCTISLSDTLAMHIPVLEYRSILGTMLLDINMTYVALPHSKEINFEVNNYSAIESAPTDCTPATLNADLSLMSLPRVAYGGMTLRANLEYSPLGDRLIFKVTDHQILP
ncbi:MAG: hypothetical protein HN842_06825 [Gammaproteobacteria bacterium]|nr:hypothetical protein [Gammaproteobacteria bacterium]